MRTVYGAWRATYIPGQWLALSGPAAMVVMPPAPASASSLVNGVWDDVLASASITDLVRELTNWGLDKMPHLAVFFYDDDQVHGLLRGRIQVLDADSQQVLASGLGARTWFEVALNRSRLYIALENANPDQQLQLPLVIGAARVGAVFLDAEYTTQPQNDAPQLAESTPAELTPAGLPEVALTEAMQTSQVGQPVASVSAADQDGVDLLAKQDGFAAPEAGQPESASQRAVDPMQVPTPQVDAVAEPGLTPEPHLAPEQPGLVPEQPGLAPESGLIPEQSGLTPEPRPMPESGLAPEQPGLTSEPHLTPEQPLLTPEPAPQTPVGLSPTQQSVEADPPRQPATVEPTQVLGNRPAYAPGQNPVERQSQPLNLPPAEPLPTIGVPPVQSQASQVGAGQASAPEAADAWPGVSGAATYQPAATQDPSAQSSGLSQLPQFGARVASPGPWGAASSGGRQEPQPSGQLIDSVPAQFAVSAPQAPQAPQPAGWKSERPRLRPEDASNDHDGQTIFTTGIAATHKPASGGRADDSLVLAAMCPLGHANRPDTPRCRVCGAQVDSHNPQLVSAPVLASLVTSSAEVVELTGPVLIGRAPSNSGRDQDAELIRVPSPNHDVSRTHIKISPRGWNIELVDLYSTNGTTVQQPGAQPVKLNAGETIQIEIGTEIDLGDGQRITVRPPASQH